ncbi:hypothetical protein IWC96_07200 [Brevundimonas sp. BAL450]|nr:MULTISPECIES: hypothetical protein [Brevundimonas]MBG7615069.1 hypothetical protein [Brevundimonas sp. BAL450]
MSSDLYTAFAALPADSQARVLARLIHMETIHVRSAHLDDPTDTKNLYASSEFTHRLSGFILAVLNTDSPAEREAGMIATILRSVEPRGQFYVDRLGEWIAAEADRKVR